MADVRRILVIFVIAVLFSIFVFSTINAAYPAPEYSDFCDQDRYPKPYLDDARCESGNHTVNQSAVRACQDDDGVVQYEYDDDGCQVDFTCSMCQKKFNEAKDEHNFWSFIIASILGFIAVFAGMYLPGQGVDEWVGSGFMLGGLITIFIATAMFYNDISRWVRPVIILIELALVIFLAYKKLQD
jgi:uncharacterized membrane protein YraQ (UPF0718 family)